VIALVIKNRIDKINKTIHEELIIMERTEGVIAKKTQTQAYSKKYLNLGHEIRIP
jgi:hypothetical protein